MLATVILDCRLISHDSAENDSQVSTSMKGNSAVTAASVIKIRSYTVYSTRSRSGAAVENGPGAVSTVRNGVEWWEIG